MKEWLSNVEIRWFTENTFHMCAQLGPAHKVTVRGFTHKVGSVSDSSIRDCCKGTVLHLHLS